MSILKRATDSLYAIRFLKILTTDWKNTSAYKAGVIDENGERIVKHSEMTPEQKSSYTMFHRLVYNLKRTLNFTGKARRWASYATALYMIKEHTKSETVIDAFIKYVELEDKNPIIESYTISSIDITPGPYYIKEELLLKDFDVLISEGSKVIMYNASPIDTVLGIDIFEAIDEKTNRTVLVTKDILSEDAPTNSTGSAIATKDTPLFTKGRKKVKVKNKDYCDIIYRGNFKCIEHHFLKNDSIVLENTDTNKSIVVKYN